MNSVPSDTPKFASLSSSLLARKGGARPAMRRPTAEIPHGAEALSADANHDMGHDLGWNDMGYDVSPPVDIAPVRLANPLAAAIPEVQPEVKRQQMEIAAKLSALVEEAPVFESPAPAQQNVAAPTLPAPTLAAPRIELSDAEATRLIKPVLREITLKSRKQGRGRTRKAVSATAAFTLRLDHDRHLKLRLACAVHNVSAQKLITEAVDSLFDSMPEIEPLITRINAQ